MGLPGVELGSSGLGDQEIESVKRALMVEARDRCVTPEGDKFLGLISHHLDT